ncbi:hypothetical protein ABEB36_010604 [Hypothenemus hampei]|uniref:Transposase n=1 Tax=Hypothenemus hampei TaxID=57062 RepID=A0ABD1ECT4_HYPHA
MPKPLNSSSKKLVASLLNYFEIEKENNGPLIPISAVRQRDADALNLSINTVSKISQDLTNNRVLSSPKKKRSYAKRVTDTEKLDVSVIRNTIYEMYEKKQHITLLFLLKVVKDRQLFNGCRRSLHTLLRNIGFKWQNDNPRRGLMELPDIAWKKINFLKSYHREKEGLYQFIFLDETWIFQNGTIGRS